MSMSTIEFNGIVKPYLVLERDWTLPAWAPIEREFITIAGRAGGVQTEMRTGMRRFSLPVIIRSKSFEERQLFLEDMAAWLIHKEAKPLKFSKYPGRTLYARIEGSPDFAQLWKFGEGVIEIVCADPYEYADPQTFLFTSGVASVLNRGTAKASPVYELNVIEDVAHVDIFSDEKYIRLGEPEFADETVRERQTLILNDTMKNLNGWADANDVDNGYIAGNMTATQAGFEATNFGVAILPKKWQGPSKRRSLPEPLQNFRADIPVELLNVERETGMIEVYFLDALGNTVIKIGIEDVWPTLKKNQAKFQLGNVDNRKVEYYRTADYAPAWNDFRGMIRIYRDGNRFRPYFAQVSKDGKHTWVASAFMYTDVAEEYLAKITQIQVAIRKWPGTSTSQAKMRIGGVKIWRLNEQYEGPSYIARAGDKIIIDTEKSIVLLNGEKRDDLKDFFSDYFDLPTGQTTLLLQPSEKVNGKIIVSERFL